MKVPLSPPMSDDERAVAILAGEYWVCDRHGVLTADQVSLASLIGFDTTWVWCLLEAWWVLPGRTHFAHYARKGESCGSH